MGEGPELGRAAQVELHARIDVEGLVEIVGLDPQHVARGRPLEEEEAVDHATRIAGEEQVLGAEAVGVDERLVTKAVEEPGGGVLEAAVDGALDLEMEPVHLPGAADAEDASHVFANRRGGRGARRSRWAAGRRVRRSAGEPRAARG